jgi:hypothetical protein
MQVDVIRTPENPDYMQIARALLPKMKEAAEDPEIMERFREWKKARDAERRQR